MPLELHGVLVNATLSPDKLTCFYAPALAPFLSWRSAFFFFPCAQSEIRKYRDVYRLYEFPRRPQVTPQINGAMTPRSRQYAPPSSRPAAGVDSKAAMGWAKHVTRETNPR